MDEVKKFWLLFDAESTFGIGSWLRRVRCRVIHGHVMVKYGTKRGYLPGYKNQQPIGCYMCARCLHCENLFDIPEAL